MNYILIILLILILIIITCLNVKKIDVETFTDKKEIPKIIWSYWDQGLDNAPDFVKLCLSANNSLQYFVQSK